MNFRNKKILSFFLSMALVIGILVGAVPASAEGTKTLTIVHVNDVHARLNLDEREKGMGFSRLKTKVDELKAANPNTILLNAGDALHGTTDINLTKGEEMVKLMNLIGFDALVPGNHDFNYGYDRLLELKGMAEFDVLGANIIKEADNKSDFEAYTIKEMDGIKVGIFGLATEETKYKSHPNNTVGIKFDNPVEVSKKMVKKLKEEKVDVIIALVHLGTDESTESNVYDIADKVEGIDLIVDGHSHTELPEGELRGNTLIVQADSYLKNIGIVNIEISEGKVVNKKAELFGFEKAKDLTPNPAIEEAIAKITEITEPLKAPVVGKSKTDLVGERGVVRTGEANLGNLITDAMVKSTGADVALTNGGGIRASIPAGDVTMGQILTAFPFTNTLAVIEVTGSEIMQALEHAVDSYPEEAGKFPHVSGMTFKFDGNKPAGERVLDLMIKQEPVKLDGKYKLVTNDFMAGGGDDFTMFEGKPFIAEGGLLSDVLIDYFKELGEVAYEVEGRIVGLPLEVKEEVKEEVVEETTPAEEVKPEPKPEVKPVPEIKPEPVAKKYTVKSGDVLWRIAKQFNTTWQELAKLNNLKNPNLIFPNQVILVP